MFSDARMGMLLPSLIYLPTAMEEAKRGLIHSTLSRWNTLSELQDASQNQNILYIRTIPEEHWNKALRNYITMHIPVPTLEMVIAQLGVAKVDAEDIVVRFIDMKGL